MSVKNKNIWILLVFILSGLVIGGFLGSITSGIDGLSWLSYGQGFGLEQPLVLNLDILSITFGFKMKINIASIIGIALAIYIYRKI